MIECISLSDEQFITILKEEESNFFIKHPLNEEIQADLTLDISRKTVEIKSMIKNSKNIDEVRVRVGSFIENIYSENEFIYNVFYENEDI
jgi:hypothetical protein